MILCIIHCSDSWDIYRCLQNTIKTFNFHLSYLSFLHTPSTKEGEKGEGREDGTRLCRE